MALTQKEMDGVYTTVTIEMVRMFGMLSHLYMKSDKKEKAVLLAKIENEIRRYWEQFKQRDEKFSV